MKFKIGSEVRHILTGTKYLVIGNKNIPHNLPNGNDLYPDGNYDYLLLELDEPVPIQIISEFEAAIEPWETVF